MWEQVQSLEYQIKYMEAAHANQLQQTQKQAETIVVEAKAQLESERQQIHKAGQMERELAQLKEAHKKEL